MCDVVYLPRGSRLCNAMTNDKESDVTKMMNTMRSGGHGETSTTVRRRDTIGFIWKE